MPTYEYRCTKGHTFEAFQSISDEPLSKCEICGRKVVRVLHSPAVHFKGSGFYNTDYGTKKRQREQKSSSDSSSSERSSSGSSGSSDSSDSSGSSDSTGSTEKPAPTPASDSKSGTEKAAPSS